MTVTKTVQISRLHPSDVDDLAKTFRSADQVYNPYTCDRANNLKHQIIQLVGEVEREIDSNPHTALTGPYSTNLDQYVETVNSTIHNLSGSTSSELPSDLRFLQLAHFHQPIVDGHVYSFGIMMHYENQQGSNASEFAVLLPFSVGGVPAYLLRNNSPQEPIKTLGLIERALIFSREKLLNC